MSTENGTKPAEKTTLPQIMPAGGQVVAVVPQSVEEIFRVSKGVVQSGLAPYALTGKIKTAEDMQKATAAVAIVIMAGAELGLPAMVSLRSFTAINGRPALYGDGLINVVRRSSRAAFIRTGYTRDDMNLLIAAGVLPSDDAEKRSPGAQQKAFDAMTTDERTFGWCAARRKDTKEERTMVFSVADAKRAGLWQSEAEVMKEVWDNGQKVKRKVANDSPWYRYPQRMAPWRAAGYCLRELFGDVLGGITDEWEAREIAMPSTEMRDVTPSRQSLEAPDPPEPETAAAQQTAAEPASAEDTSQADMGGGASEFPYFDVGAFLTRLEEEMSVATDEPTVQEVWELHIVNGPGELSMEDMALAEKVRDRALSRINSAQATAAGQGDIFPGDR